MILNEIQIPLDKIDEFFLQHRDGVDPENYRVGKIDDKIIVYNPDSQKFMEYFYDDCENTWIDLSIIDNDYNGYKINKDSLNFLGKRGVLKLTSAKNGYKLLSITTSSGKKFKKLSHIIISKIFIPNLDPINNNIVDHINNIRDDNRKDNLRWVTSSLNNINRSSFSRKSNIRYLSYSDKEKINLVGEYTIDELSTHGYEKQTVINCSLHNTKYKNVWWVRQDLNIEEYLNNINEELLDNSLWEVHYTGLLVHPLGLCKSPYFDIPTIGTLTKSGYRVIKYNNKSRFIHRYVAETFLNNNKPISEGYVVDHINTNPTDNRYSNLKIVTQKENMNNINTRKSLGKKVIDKNGKIYNSTVDCARENLISQSTICRWIKNKPEKGFRYYKP